MSVGVCGKTGKVLLGWKHTVASIHVTLSTELATRIERRDFGSVVPRLIDEPGNEETRINFIMGVAEALEPRRVRNVWYGEPRFRLIETRVDLSIPGKAQLFMPGEYFPRGHLGDFSNPSPREVFYSLNDVFDP
jgi:phage baseplate assembly protein W